MQYALDKIYWRIFEFQLYRSISIMFNFTHTLLVYWAWAEHFLNGYLTHTTLVWSEGRSEWQPLSSIPELVIQVTCHDQETQVTNAG